MPAALHGIWLPIANIQSSPTDHQLIAGTHPHELGINGDMMDDPNEEIQSSRLPPSERSWQPKDSHRPEHAIANGYGQLVASRIDDGWSAYLVTIVFQHFAGPKKAVLGRMKDEIQRIYSTLVTYVHRRPKTAPVDKLPVLIAVADLPVPKRGKVAVLRSCNGGLHFHAIVIVPPDSRLKGSVVEHFESKADRYAGPREFVANIHVKPITHDCQRMTDYVFKSVIRRRLSYDDALLIMPRTRSELGPFDRLRSEAAECSAANSR